VPLIKKKFTARNPSNKSTHRDVRPSTLSKASTGRVFRPQFCSTKRFKLRRPEKASFSIVSNLLSDNILRKIRKWENGDV
jgi:hypothetical protein